MEHRRLILLRAAGVLVALGIPAIAAFILPPGIGVSLTDSVRAADNPQPPYPHGAYRDDCSICHSAEGWTPATVTDSFEHARSGFALEGAHDAAPCRSCHTSLEFGRADRACVTCHLDVHEGELGTDCQRCHTTSQFVDHAEDVRAHRLTRFPLSGVHATLDCASCHPAQPQGGLRFVNTPMECAACHLDEYQATTDPDHAALGFDRDCTACHATRTWTRVDSENFDHGTTGFVLSGAHRGLDCQQCHGDGSFAGTTADCLSCHQEQFQIAVQPDHVAGGFPTQCQQCHTSQSWSPAEFDHGITSFPLVGSHGNVDCQQCHTGGQFSAVPSDCNSCHQTDYQAAAGHVASSFPLTCEQCHTVTIWTDATFEHTTFPLTGGHTGTTCQECHTGGTYEPLPTECVFCHQSDYVEAPSHVASNFSQTCENCHSVSVWSDATYPHDSFPLSGGHAGPTCQECHISGVYEAMPTDCISCHPQDYQEAPNHLDGNFPLTCDECHTITTWQGAEFNHDLFPLSGGHGGVSCADCHTSGTYGTIPTDCNSCHQTDYQAAAGHVSSGFPLTCEQCHTVTTWLDATFEHTTFPLTGGHTGTTCQECHTSGTYDPLPTDCVFCHQSDYVEAPSHVASNFSQTCENCHSVSVWSDATYPHDAFPLTAGHASPTCVQCHTSGIYETIPADCFSCHQPDYQTAAGHVSSGFPTTCEECHSTTVWTDAAFDHDLFPLSGGHNGVTCVDCHTSGTYGTIPTDCNSCHQTDYQAAPGHVASGFPLTCEQCHTVTTWLDATFEHATFPLTGSHNGLACQDCHTSGTYGTIPTDCNSCHQTDYQAAVGHVASGFPLTCEQCHTVTTWLDATFEHTTFPLTGGHTGTTCQECHTSGTYDPLPTDCVFCHQSDYVEAPSHVASNFPQTCENCHTVSVWSDATYPHDSFSLSGGHNGLTCVQCHTSGVYGTIPADCYTCHQPDYQTAVGHVSSGFPTECEQCHSTATWLNATFDHALFPLTAGHNGLACQDCHTSVTYGTIPTDCNSCHQTDYQAAPGHVASGFPLTCEQCHATTTWLDATFDHNFFALSGGHNGLTCQECHTSGTYGTMPTDCVFCHQSDYVEAPSHVASNFPQACENCHSVTVWSNATYPHGFFPLSGGHNGLTCVQCHTSGVYGTIPADCYACHQTEYQSAPSHAASGFPTTCEQCHATTTWLDATFDHNFFPLSGGHNGLACVQCHTSGTFGTIPSDCHWCHQTDYDSAPDHQTLGFPLDCQQCHNTTAWSAVNFVHSFPLNGPHTGRECSDCHLEGTTSTFSCLGTCHEHTQSDVADDHSQVNGYVYDFLACLNCHPDGRH